MGKGAGTELDSVPDCWAWVRCSLTARDCVTKHGTGLQQSSGYTFKPYTLVLEVLNRQRASCKGALGLHWHYSEYLSTEIVNFRARLHELTLFQWNRINDRLSSAEQKYIALPDRATIADLSYFPFSMPWMFEFFKVDINEWPHVAKWAERMMARPAVANVLENGPTYGH